MNKLDHIFQLIAANIFIYAAILLTIFFIAPSFAFAYVVSDGSNHCDFTPDIPTATTDSVASVSFLPDYGAIFAPDGTNLGPCKNFSGDLAGWIANNDHPSSAQSGDYHAILASGGSFVSACYGGTSDYTTCLGESGVTASGVYFTYTPPAPPPPPPPEPGSGGSNGIFMWGTFLFALTGIMWRILI